MLTFTTLFSMSQKSRIQEVSLKTMEWFFIYLLSAEGRTTCDRVLCETLWDFLKPEMEPKQAFRADDMNRIHKDFGNVRFL